MSRIGFRKDNVQDTKGKIKMKKNYQLILDSEISNLNGRRAKLLLHSCCAPCSTYVLEYLSRFFDITVFYYNPNIYPKDEFFMRVNEQKRLIETMFPDSSVGFIEGEYDDDRFYAAVKGLEKLGEGSQRCYECFKLRFEETAKRAAEGGFEYFTTTLSISPHKNSQVLNELGADIAEKYGIKYLFSDFKKKNGYKRSCELSAQFGIYRQNYCGCVFSKNEREIK